MCLSGSSNKKGRRRHTPHLQIACEANARPVQGEFSAAQEGREAGWEQRELDRCLAGSLAKEEMSHPHETTSFQEGVGALCAPRSWNKSLHHLLFEADVVDSLKATLLVLKQVRWIHYIDFLSDLHARRIISVGIYLFCSKLALCLLTQNSYHLSWKYIGTLVAKQIFCKR